MKTDSWMNSEKPNVRNWLTFQSSWIAEITSLNSFFQGVIEFKDQSGLFDEKETGNYDQGFVVTKTGSFCKFGNNSNLRMLGSCIAPVLSSLSTFPHKKKNKEQHQSLFSGYNCSSMHTFHQNLSC